MILFLGSSLRNARTDIIHDYDVVDFQAQDRGQIRLDGEIVEFRIVTCERHMQGLRPTSWIRLPSGLDVDGRMIGLAEALVSRRA